MSAAQRPASPRLIDGLLAQPHRYQFFQAVRVLARQLQLEQGVAPERGVGEQIRFGSSLSLGFPPSEIETLQPLAGTGQPIRYRMVPAFIGMTGPNGAMPRVYTEQLAERQQLQRDSSAHAFMDVFNNRMVALFYRAWLKYRLPLRHEVGQRFLPELLSLAGRHIGLESTTQPGSEPYAAYAGLLRQHTVSADNLRKVLAEHFDAAVEVEQFVGQWFELPAAQQTRLGRQMAALGEDACCGARIWDRQSRLRLRFGPLRSRAYQALLPGGSAARALAELLRYWCGLSTEFEICLVLHCNDVQPARLDGQSGQLGRDTVMCSRKPRRHIEEARYVLSS